MGKHSYTREPKHGLPRETLSRRQNAVAVVAEAIEFYLAEMAASYGKPAPLLGDWLVATETSLIDTSEDLSHDPMGTPVSIIFTGVGVDCDSARGLAVTAAKTLYEQHQAHSSEGEGEHS